MLFLSNVDWLSVRKGTHFCDWNIVSNGIIFITQSTPKMFIVAFLPSFVRATICMCCSVCVVWVLGFVVFHSSFLFSVDALFWIANWTEREKHWWATVIAAKWQSKTQRAMNITLNSFGVTIQNIIWLWHILHRLWCLYDKNINYLASSACTVVM